MNKVMLSTKRILRFLELQEVIDSLFEENDVFPEEVLEELIKLNNNCYNATQAELRYCYKLLEGEN